MTRILLILLGIFTLQTPATMAGSARDKERAVIHQQHNERAEQVGREYRRAMHAHLFEKKAYPGSVASKFVQIEQERSKELDAFEARPLNIVRPISSAGARAGAREAKSARPSATRIRVEAPSPSKPEVVIDGSAVPAELEFSGKRPAR